MARPLCSSLLFPLIAALPVDQSIDRLSAAQCAQPGGDCRTASSGIVSAATCGVRMRRG